MIMNFDIWNALTGKLWNCMGSWFNFLKQICLTVVEKVLNFQSYMNIQCLFTRNMAKLTCDSLLDLTSNANIVTGSPVPYNRFMNYICQKQFWKQILALWGKKKWIFNLSNTCKNTVERNQIYSYRWPEVWL